MAVSTPAKRGSARPLIVVLVMVVVVAVLGYGYASPYLALDRLKPAADARDAQTVSEYVTADLVADFNTVMSVKVAVLAASAPGSAKLPVAQTYNLLGTQVTAPVDTRARQVFEETIAVRNSLP